MDFFCRKPQFRRKIPRCGCHILTKESQDVGGLNTFIAYHIYHLQMVTPSPLRVLSIYFQRGALLDLVIFHWEVNLSDFEQRWQPYFYS